MKPFSLIVAIDQANGIGKDGQLPWQLPEDLKHFKKITTEVSHPDHINAVIMGRKTWESIPEKYRPLPDRLNAVLSSNHDLSLAQDVLVYRSLEEAILALQEIQEIEKIFVIGGQKVFEQALQIPACTTLYVTHIAHSYPCDVFFPDFSKGFQEASRSENLAHEGVEYYFAQYHRAPALQS